MAARTSIVRFWQGLKRRWWIPATVLFLVAAYSAADFFLVPYLAKNAIQDYFANELGHQVAVEELTFNPFSFAAEITGFSLSEADGAPLMDFGFLRIDYQLSSLVNGAWTFKEITLERLNLNIIVEVDGSLNLAKTLRPPDETIEDAQEDTDEPLPPLRFASLNVRDGRIDLEDRSHTAPFVTTLAPLSLSLNEFRTAPDFQNIYQFEGTTLADERLTWAGQFSVQPLGSTGRFTIGSLKAETIASYLQEQLPVALASGSLDVEGQYSIAINDALEISLDLPSLALHDIGIAPKTGDNADIWIDIPLMSLTNTKFAWPGQTLSVASVDIDSPSVTVWRNADG